MPKPLMHEGELVGFTLYNRDYHVSDMKATRPAVREVYLYDIKAAFDDGVVNLRYWEDLAVGILVSQYQQEGELTAGLPKNPFGTARNTRDKSLCFSTPRGSVVLLKINGGIHNVILNHPSDGYTLSKLLKQLPVNWCYATERTAALWTALGMTPINTDTRPWVPEGVSILVRKNNPRGWVGASVSMGKWDRLKNNLVKSDCVLWQITQEVT